MAFVEEPGERTSALLLTVIVIAVVVLLAVLFYGLTVAHWFGFAGPASVGAAPSVVPTPTPSASAAASP